MVRQKDFEGILEYLSELLRESSTTIRGARGVDSETYFKDASSLAQRLFPIGKSEKAGYEALLSELRSKHQQEMDMIMSSNVNGVVKFAAIVGLAALAYAMYRAHRNAQTKQLPRMQHRSGAGAGRPVVRVEPKPHVLFLIVAGAGLVDKFAKGEATSEDVAGLSTTFSSRWYGPQSDFEQDIAPGLEEAKQEKATPYSVWFIRVDLPGPDERFETFLGARQAIKNLSPTVCQTSGPLDEAVIVRLPFQHA